MRRIHSASRAAAALALAVSLSGCVTSTQATRLQKDLDEVKRQLFQVQQDTAASRTQMEELARGPGGRTGGASTSQADLNASIQALLDQIQGLSEKIRELTARMATLSQEIQGLKDAGRRGGTPSGPPPSASSPAFPDETSPEPPTSAADQSFRVAYADYSKGNYELALMGFTDFLRTSPGHPRAAEARYWVGECLYSQGKYKEAVEAFDLVITKHPGAEKEPAAMLKKGYAQIEMGQTSRGVETLGKLIAAHADTEEARLAAERLRQLGLRN